MKIKQHDLVILREKINETLATHNANGALVACYEAGEFARSDKVKDLQKRFCFDLLYGAGLNQFACNTLYKYLDDTHIYTALKSVCPTVTRHY